MPFSVHLHDEHGLTVVGLSGELDVEPAADLRVLFDMLVEDRHVDVLVDLRLLTFCDSVGLSALIHGYHAFRTAGGSLRVTGDTGLVSRLLSVTGVRAILVYQGGVCDAARSVGTAEPTVSGREPRGWQWVSDESASGHVGYEIADTGGAGRGGTGHAP
jgi:anti-sigma B factor antagonist